MYIYIHIYIHTCNHENYVPSQLSPQWSRGNLCTWAHNVRLHLLVPMNQRVLNKESKERNISGDK